MEVFPEGFGQDLELMQRVRRPYGVEARIEGAISIDDWSLVI